MNTHPAACPTNLTQHHPTSYLAASCPVTGSTSTAAAFFNPASSTNTTNNHAFGNYNNNSSNPATSGACTSVTGPVTSATAYSTLPVYGYAGGAAMLGMWNPTNSGRYYMMGVGGSGYVYPGLNSTPAYVTATPINSYAGAAQSRGVAGNLGNVSKVPQTPATSQPGTQLLRQNVDLLAGTTLPAAQQPLYHAPVLLSHPTLAATAVATTPNNKTLVNSRSESTVSDTSPSAAVVAYQRKMVHKVPTTLRVSLGGEICEDFVLENLNRPNIGVRRDTANATLYIEFSHVRDCADAKLRLDQLGISSETELTSEKDPTNIYITGIPDSVDFDSDALRCYFKQFGSIQSTKIVERNGLERVGFVRYQKPEEATAAIKCLNLIIEGRQVTCKYANKTRGVSTPAPAAAVSNSTGPLDASAPANVMANNYLRRSASTWIANGTGGLDYGGVVDATATPQTISYLTFLPPTAGYCPTFTGASFPAAAATAPAAGTAVADCGVNGALVTPQLYSPIPYWNSYAGTMASATGEVAQ